MKWNRMRTQRSDQEWHGLLFSEDQEKRWANCEPVPEDEMEFTGHHYTVCEILRQIYRRTRDPETRLMCRRATTMAKHMATAISELAHDGHWGREFYPWNPAKRCERLKAREREKLASRDEKTGKEGA